MSQCNCRSKTTFEEVLLRLKRFLVKYVKISYRSHLNFPTRHFLPLFQVSLSQNVLLLLTFTNDVFQVCSYSGLTSFDKNRYKLFVHKEGMCFCILSSLKLASS